jgi:hypothetical protein
VFGPTASKLRRQADRYALELMAPDGQLSLSGRSLDQSWVQAAAAALGARRAAIEPANAAAWRSYAQRAVSYLQAAYPLQPNGLLPIVPGLGFDWSPSIMDGYAALNQYEGLTLWLLSDALAKWPRAGASQASLPTDNRELLVDDLASSGLVWGRAGSVWWQLAGRATSSDPRSAHDLLALRPIHGNASSTWTLAYANGTIAAPNFTGVHGTGHKLLLLGRYRTTTGRVLGRVGWALNTTAKGIELSMSMPAKTTLHTTVWLTPERGHLFAPGATITHGACTVTASGDACPATIYWRNQRTATLELD